MEIPEVDLSTDFGATSYISREILRWGKLPVHLLSALDLQNQRYAFLGTNDWSMYPVLVPGSFLQIDESKTKISHEAWSYEIERPVYFLETRDSFRCGWCSLSQGHLILQPHWSSGIKPEVFRYPGEIDVVGQVVGVAMRVGPVKRRRIHS